MSGPGQTPPSGLSDETAGEVGSLNAAEQRQADIELCRALQAAEFDPVVWRPVAEALARYGCAVMEAWLRNGIITKKCRQQGLGLVPLPRSVLDSGGEAADTRRGLVGETVAKALVSFKDNLRKGGWDPTKGRSLRSYFLGACLYEFPSVLAKWRRGEDRWNQAQDALRYEIAVEVEPRVDPACLRDATEQLDTLLANEDERTVTIARLYADGYSTAEIATVLGISQSTVRRRRQALRETLPQSHRRALSASEKGAGDECEC